MEFRPFYVAREWASDGHDVTIMAASFSHLRNSQPAVSRSLSVDCIEGVRYLWIKTPQYQGNHVGRLINMLSFVGQLLFLFPYIAQRYRPETVIASSTYPLDIFPAFCIARLSKAKLVFEVHDLWPLTLIELGGMSRWHPLIIAMQFAENFAYRMADRVVSILPCAGAYMRTRGFCNEKLVHVPNGIDTTEWDVPYGSLGDPHRSTLDRLHRENRFILAYIGAHGLANALDCVVPTAELLCEYPVSFLLVGHGPEKDKLQTLCSEKGLSNVVFLPPVAKATIPLLLKRVDIAFILFRRSLIYRFGVSPNKLMDYMMAAKPIIQAVDVESDIVSQSRCGLTIPPENAHAFASAIRHLMTLPKDERFAMGERGRQYVLNHHNYHILAQQFLAAARAC
jgi:glycosyltransferase involved in cell wall biosynthesis